MNNRLNNGSEIAVKSDVLHILLTVFTVLAITLLSISLFREDLLESEAFEQVKHYNGDATRTENEYEELQYYYNSDDKLFNESYGPDGLKNLDLEVENAVLSQAVCCELKKRIKNDPVLAAMCVSYYLKKKGEYTEYYFPTLSNKDSIDITINKFISNPDLWKNAVTMFADTLDDSFLSMIPMKEESFYTYLLSGGVDHPTVFEYSESMIENSNLLHVLSVQTHSKKGDDITLLFLVEGGFMPISYES